MPGFDDQFWELPFDPADLDAIPRDFFEQAEPESPEAPERQRARRAVLRELSELVHTRLTDRQRQLIELYFYDGRTQEEIAAKLGVSQQAVSRQLFGVLRNGRRVGGAINRLRKLGEERGWDPSKWV